MIKSNLIKILLVVIILSIIIVTIIDNNKEYYTKGFFEKKDEFELDNIIKKRDKYLNYNNYDMHVSNQYIKSNLPWSNVINTSDDIYPYIFCIKLNIPSLNDYENWKQLIPNINFNPTSKELELPCKDEASALAIINLISSNFAGQISIREILDKNLLEISINKAKKHEIVKNKLREQIINKLYLNKKDEKDEKDTARYEKDLVNINNNDNENETIHAYDGSDFSYL